MSNNVYKIVSADLWRQAEKQGLFTGAGIDIGDGFIHLSTAKQTRKTCELYFAGQEGLVLVEVDGAALGPALKYESSRDGDLFPHLYAPLPLSAVVKVTYLHLDAEGGHLLPREIP